MSPTSHILIVGAGPAGMILAHILARNHIQTTLLEMHADFDRDFRGDTIHASTMEVLDQLGLADELLSLPHEKMHQGSIIASGRKFELARFSNLKTKYPYVTLMPQSQFLDFLDRHSSKFPHYTCLRNTTARELVWEDKQVTGVSVRHNGEERTIRADLVVAADGRFSTMRKLSGVPLLNDDLPSDVAWCRVSRDPTDNTYPGGIHTHNGTIVVLLPREDCLQLGCVFPKGEFARLKKAGLAHYQTRIATTVPQLADRVTEIDSWEKVHLLNIRSDCLQQWSLAGLLLIGDAAHVMSPVGGVGINCAIADAVATANIVVSAAREGTLTQAHLQQVQQRRFAPTRQVQRVQSIVQKRVLSLALKEKNFRPPWFARVLLKVPVLRNLPARFVAFGPQPELLDPALLGR